MAYNPTYYASKRLDILKRIQRDKDQFIQDIVDLTGRLITSNVEDNKALQEIEEAEKASVEAAPPEA